jgi:hypothetical protein
MSKRVDSAVESALVNCVDSAHEPAHEIDTRGLMRAAVEMSGKQHKECAAKVDRSADYWNRILSGERGISLDALGRLPVEVQREFLKLWSRALGGRYVDNDSQAEALAKLAQAAIQALSGGAL